MKSKKKKKKQQPRKHKLDCYGCSGMVGKVTFMEPHTELRELGDLGKW